MIRNGIMRTVSDRVLLRPILLMAGVCLMLGVISCSGGGQSGSSSIAFAATPLAPPASVALASTVSFAAVVAGGASAQGVNWTITCTPGPANVGCGTITSHTASGYPTTYLPPSGPDNPNELIPVGGTVTVTASSTADLSQSVSATIQITVAPISVGFNLAPPTSMLTGATANVIVYVSNDSTNAGADLSLTCGSPGACGSIIPAHTSGTLTGFVVYTAPLIVPLGGTVTITAASTADPTQSAITTVTITQAKLTITLSQTPPPNLPVGAATNLTAVVTFDPNNAGIDWTATCQGNSCGTFSLNHTASGQLTTYTAPSAVPPGNVVTITAASTTTPTTTATAIVTVTPASLRDDLLNGQYAFLLQGVRAGGSWAIAGTLLADGIGNIDSATETFLGGGTAPSLSGTYFIDSDGTGTITLNGAPTGQEYWYNGQQTFQVSVVSSVPGVLSMEEFDGYYDPTLHVAYGGTLTGTLEQQTLSAPGLSAGAYAFLLSGFGPQNSPAFYGGTLSGSSFNFTMDRSIAGVNDSISGYLSFPSSTIIFNDASGQPYTFAYYVVDSGHLILIAISSGGGDLSAGHLYLQPTPAASVATICPDPASYFGFTEAGAIPLQLSAPAQGSSPLAVGGIFSCDPLGNVTGLLDGNVNGNVSSAPVSGSLSISPTPNDSGTSGTLALTGGAAQVFGVYPTATNGVLLLEKDTPGSGVGIAYQQTPGAAFSGTYAAAYQTLGQINPPSNGAAVGQVGAWNDFLGVLTAGSQSTLVGSVDLDQFDESSGAFWTQTIDAALSGNFSATGQQGRFTGSFSISCPAGSTGCTSPPVTSNQVFYILNDSTVLSLGLDSGPSTGILQSQQF
jgi:hypothetical protein